VTKDSKYQSVRENTENPFSMFLGVRIFRRGRFVYSDATDPGNDAAALAREVRALDANLAPYEMITLQEQVDRSTSPQQVAVTLVGILGALALLLAVIGLYGVMSYAVCRRVPASWGLRMGAGAGASIYCGW